MPENGEDKHAHRVSRRAFIKGAGAAAAAASLLGGATPLPTAEVAADSSPKPDAGIAEQLGPGPATIEVKVNGASRKLTVEPRVTLLEALRNHLGLYGTKLVCDRGACGACTVLMDGKPVYACSILAIDAQGRDFKTIEALAEGDSLSPVMQAFVAHDAQQCGFCTPGFIVATTSFLHKNPSPTPEQIRHGLSGNFCRCGTYDGIRAVALASGRGK